MAKVVALLLVAIAVSAMLVQVECDASVDKPLKKENQVIAEALKAIAAALPTEEAEIEAPVDKPLIEANQAITEALDGVVAIAPPAKKAEIEDATWKQRVFALAALAMAEGDEKKVATSSLAYKNAANAVLAAAPADKFKVMEKSFKVAARQAIA